GELKEFNCTNCKSYFRISFIDYKSSSGGVTDKDSTFYNGYYNYASLTGTASRYVVYDSAFSLGQLPNYNWSLGNNSTSTSQFAVSTYTQPGKYNTCLNVQFAGACSSSLCNTFNLGNTGPSIEVDIGFLPPAGNTFNFTAQANSGTPPFSYNWNLGDGTILSTKTITHTYSMAGSYQVTLTITDAKGVSATRKQNVRTQGSTDCITTFISSVIPVSNPDNLGNIVIEWIDENKIVYSTLQGAQSNESYFQVLSIEQYEPNGLGQPIKKIKAKLNCVLHNGATSIELKNAEVVFAIATN
ncbi:MAG: PKD domain-containing protein, partial [Bacteroidia bacterium]